MQSSDASASPGGPGSRPPWRRRRRAIAGWLVLIILIWMPLLIPAGREWAMWVISGGRTLAPKGMNPVEGPWRPWDKPTDPRELEAYEHAHALQLPEGLPEPVPFGFDAHWYKKRRATARAYFDHLCETEAGEYIFRTVEDVEGIYQMRAMPKPSVKLFTDRYGFEDPADWSSGESDGSPTLFIGGPGNGFRYFESRQSPEEIAAKLYRKNWVISFLHEQERQKALYWRYYDFDSTKLSSGKVDQVSSLNSRYAYTWRGIQRERDREFGIAGGELIVLDRETNEILGVRRSFAVAPQYNRNLDWEFAYFCPNTLLKDRSRRTLSKSVYPFSFIFQILDPVDYDNSRFKLN